MSLIKQGCLNALETQGESVERIKTYLEYLEVKHNSSLDSLQKIETLKIILKKDRYLHRIVIKELFNLDSEIAWSNIDKTQIDTILDILWYLPDYKLQLDIILESNLLKSIYFARGDIDIYPSEPSGEFAFDILCASKRAGFNVGDIEFIYICTECKNYYPISFERCPNCMAVNSIKIEEQVANKETKRGDTLL